MIARLFYSLYLLFTKKPSVKTYLHPDYKKLVKYAFTSVDEKSNPVDFYTFPSAADMPTARYTKWNEFLEDYNRRFDNQELLEVAKEIADALNKNSVAGVTQARLLVDYILQRTQIAMDVDLFLRFCSVTYFTQDEDLTSYDWDYGTWKIELWKRGGLHAFFSKEPVKKWLPLTELSPIDLDILQQYKKNLRRIYKRPESGATT